MNLSKAQHALILRPFLEWCQVRLVDIIYLIRSIGVGRHRYNRGSGAAVDMSRALYTAGMPSAGNFTKRRLALGGAHPYHGQSICTWKTI